MQTLRFYLIFFLSFYLESRSYIDYESPYHPVVGTEGMVVSQNYLSSEIGVEILNKGGNAVDAAVAVGFSLAATLPRAGNLGGGGFMLVYIKEKDEIFFIDYRSSAPLNSNLENIFGLSSNSNKKLESLPKNFQREDFEKYNTEDYYQWLLEKFPTLMYALGGTVMSHQTSEDIQVLLLCYRKCGTQRVG